MGGCYSVAPSTGPHCRHWRRNRPVHAAAGAKLYIKNLTAIVTMADDGGGSGRLRQDLGMLPPGISAAAWRLWPTPSL